MRTLAGLLRVLGCLVGGGRGPRAALTALSADPNDPALARLAAKINDVLKPGVVLSKALATVHAPSVVVEILRRGEATGEHTAALARAAAWLERTAEARDRVWTAIFAPGRIAVPVLAFALWVGVQVAPAFRAMYDTMNLEVPGFVGLVLDAALFVGEHAPALIALAGLFALLVRSMGRRSCHALSRVLRMMPLLGRHWRAWTLAEFSRALAWLLQAGVPLPDALACAAAASGDPDYGRCVAGALPRVLAGERAADALAPAPWDAGFSALLAEGESTRSLADLLAGTCDVRDRMVGRELERAAVRFELCALAGLACVGFFALVAILSPLLPHSCCCI